MTQEPTIERTQDMNTKPPIHTRPIYAGNVVGYNANLRTSCALLRPARSFLLTRNIVARMILERSQRRLTCAIG
jgi:hypothetical protein